jgi:uncharacterized membrane protein YozB (DUF420 family)
MGLAKGFRILNLVLLIAAAVLMLVTPLYYDVQRIVLTVRETDNITYKTTDVLSSIDTIAAYDIDYTLRTLDGEYVKIDSVTKETRDGSWTTTINGEERVEEYNGATIYVVDATVYSKDNAATGVVYHFELNDKDYQILGGIAKDDVFYLGIKSVSSSIKTEDVGENIAKYDARDELIRYNVVTGANALFSNDNNGTTNSFVFLFVTVCAGAVTLLASLFLMRKRTEVIAANVIAAVIGLATVLFAAIFFTTLAPHVAQVNGTGLAITSVVVAGISMFTGLVGAAFAMKQKECKMLGKVMTTVSAISAVVLLFLTFSSIGKSTALIIVPVFGLILTLAELALSIVTLLVFSKNQKNEKLNENGVIEEDNTYVDPNAQPAEDTNE